ncbi:MAG: efflux RND transporter permease subunit [Actinocatenispora sp.]
MRHRSRLWLLLPAVLVVVWLLAAGPLGSYVGKLTDVQENDSAAFLPAGAESTKVQDSAKKFTPTDAVPAIVVYKRSGKLQRDDLTAMQADTRHLRDLGARRGKIVGPIPSKDKTAAELIVPLDSGADLTKVVDKIRDEVDGHPGLRTHVGGPGGLQADMSKAFAGIDGTLLVVTSALVFVILIVVYRSPLLPVAVLVTAMLALAVAGAVIYPLADHDVIDLNGQSQGILFILVIGACTDYSLLLVSRYREELRRERHRIEALVNAYRAAFAPIVASGGTVILGVLCLLITNLKSTSSLGPVAAIGIGASLLAALTFLPAVLALTGRAAFWPVRPRFGSTEGNRLGVWGRAARFVGRSPRRTWLVVTVVLFALTAAFLPQLRASGTSATDIFLNKEDSVTAQTVINDHFPAGAGSPTQIVADAGSVDEIVAAARGVSGVVTNSVAPMPTSERPGADPKVLDGRVLVNVTLTHAPDSKAAIRTVDRLRDAVHTVPGAHAEVGGYTAIQADTLSTSERDRSVVIPLVLVVILLVLILLLRSLVAPLLLVSTVVLSFGATLAVSAAVFNHLLGWPGADPSIPLFAFVFLVALGVDYNIFLMSRVREESARHGTREGTLLGLRATGGVITSAGIVLAATFAALAVLPILFLAQIAFLVAFGVLLDTLLVRSLLVPAIVVDLDRRTWWPGALSRRPGAPAGKDRSAPRASAGPGTPGGSTPDGTRGAGRHALDGAGAGRQFGGGNGHGNGRGAFVPARSGYQPQNGGPRHSAEDQRTAATASTSTSWPV